MKPALAAGKTSKSVHMMESSAQSLVAILNRSLASLYSSRTKNIIQGLKNRRKKIIIKSYLQWTKFCKQRQKNQNIIRPLFDLSQPSITKRNSQLTCSGQDNEYLRTCGVLITEQINVEIAEDNMSSEGFKIFFGILLESPSLFVASESCFFVVYNKKRVKHYSETNN